MSEKKEDPFGMTSMVDAWMKSMGDLWGNMSGQQWGGTQGPQQAWAKGDQKASSKAQANMDAAMRNWKTMAGTMATPEAMTSLFEGSNAMPEVLLKLTQSSLGGFVEMQQKMAERISRMGAAAEAYDFQDIDENIFQIWTDTYEKEFKQFFQIPQLGLFRTYQEKNNQVADKFNLFQSTLSEFLNLFSLPFSRSMPVMQEKLVEMAEKGELPDDSKTYYNMWVKVLEGHYMTLFQTPEYVETLARTVNSLADYTAVRDSALEDLLNQLPVATRSDMDDMARELYEVKKRLRMLSKELKK
jgi:hypothetical protein